MAKTQEVSVPNKMPKREGKGRRPGSFHRNKKASQYRAQSQRAIDEGDLREGRVLDILYRGQLCNQERQCTLKTPGVHLTHDEVSAHLEEFEQAFSPAAFC